MDSRKYFLVFVFLFVFLCGCVQTGPVCEGSYVLIEGYCCLDGDNNGICDNYDAKVATSSLVANIATTTTSTSIKTTRAITTTTTTSSTTTMKSTATTTSKASTCVESHGNNPNVAGYCQDSYHPGDVLRDYCKLDNIEDAYYLVKYYCDQNGECQPNFKSYECPNVCVGDTCYNPSASECFETDNGDIPTNPGVVYTGTYGRLNDMCSNSKKDVLLERICRPALTTKEYNCSEVCHSCICKNVTNHPKGGVGYCD